MIKKIITWVVVFMMWAASVGAGNKITPSVGNYILAILPVMNMSGLDQRTMEAVGNGVQETLKQKYPAGKTKVRFIDNDAINRVMASQPFENAEAPQLKELVQIGKSLGADRLMFLSLLTTSDKESGFMVIVGTGTIRANVIMKQKMVDVGQGKFLYNNNTVAKGVSNSLNFWRLGSPSKIRAVKKGVVQAMEQFLGAFE